MTLLEATSILPEPALAPSLPNHESFTVTTPRVLIVEDDLDVHEGWSLFLRHHGYEVMSAEDGLEGLETIEGENPDVVLLDLGLPSMDGLTMLEVMRERGLDVPVIIVTATSSVQVDLQARGLGACVVLSKPLNPGSLVPLIEDLAGD